MSGFVSIYLDAVRFFAAMGVFLSHADQHAGLFTLLPTVPFDHFDHKLVIFFFVISGYVIAASASRPERTGANYSADRLARLSSVAVPALALTYLLDAIGKGASPELYSFIDPHWGFCRFLLNLFYCQQIWFVSANPSSNAPFWSLGYEFWYYVLFGVWIFARPKGLKILLLLLVAAFVGPKILLLLPAWALGALAFYATKRWQCSWQNSILLFVGSGILLAAGVVLQSRIGLNNGKAGLPPLYYSSNYFGDNLFGMLVAGHFFCCGLLSQHIRGNFEGYKMVRFTRWLASHTFSLYLYHMPLLFFIRAVTKYDIHSALSVLTALAGALLTIIALSKITEERYPRLRVWLRQWLAAKVEKLTRAVVVWRSASPERAAVTVADVLPSPLDSLHTRAANDE